MATRGRPPGAAKHGIISAEIERMVTNGSYRPGDFLLPERGLAEQFSVSRPTIRRALASLVERGLLVNRRGLGTSVRGPVEEENRNHWQIIGLLVPNFTNQYFVEVTEAIEQAALQRGYQVLLANTRHQANLEEMHLQQMANARVSGVVVIHDPYSPFPESVSLLRTAGIPYVALFNSPSEADCDSAVLDDHSGVNEAMHYLYSLGHRQIAFCRATSAAYPHPRERAYSEFMAQKGLSTPLKYLIPNISGSEGEGLQILKNLFQTEDAPTAILAGNDHTALTCQTYLAHLNKRVPQDVSLVGFDNLRFTEHLSPPLTTVDQPKREMGRRAVEMLLEQIELGMSGPPRITKFHTHLVIRESCSIVSNRLDQ
jgi:GntR family transcriptional regulator, arabinose operon transcriptional repressor